MSDFTIGGSAKYGAAKALPTGTPVRIVSIEVKESRIKKEGQTEPDFQTCVVMETLKAGNTLPYEKGRGGSRVTVAAGPFKAGERFVHYYGGIYPKKAPETGWRVSERGGTFGFFAALKELGIPLTGKFENYVGVEFVVERARGTGANGTYFTPLPQALYGHGASAGNDADEEEGGEEPAPAPAPAKKKTIPKKAAKPAGNADTEAFTSLSAEDQEAVVDYVKESGGMGLVEAKDLVGVVARDIAHAEAILKAYDAQRGAA